MRLSAAYLSAATLPELARPLLADARDRLGESISLTLFDDGFVVFVARSEVTRVVSTGFRIGIRAPAWNTRSEEQTSEIQSQMRNSYAVFCLKKKKYRNHTT